MKGFSRTCDDNVEDKETFCAVLQSFVLFWRTNNQQTKNIVRLIKRVNSKQVDTAESLKYLQKYRQQPLL